MCERKNVIKNVIQNMMEMLEIEVWKIFDIQKCVKRKMSCKMSQKIVFECLSSSKNVYHEICQRNM